VSKQQAHAVSKSPGDAPVSVKRLVPERTTYRSPDHGREHAKVTFWVGFRECVILGRNVRDQAEA